MGADGGGGGGGGGGAAPSLEAPWPAARGLAALAGLVNLRALSLWQWHRWAENGWSMDCSPEDSSHLLPALGTSTSAG
jgi:hypothetical protein